MAVLGGMRLVMSEVPLYTHDRALAGRRVGGVLCPETEKCVDYVSWPLCTAFREVPSWQIETSKTTMYRGTSLKTRTPLGPYCRPVPRVLGESHGNGRFRMGEVPLYFFP